ncbi:chromatin-remodeling ATPase INO80 [Hetaerina americana]|uniref:chromatin-remodeling ATPase INO80 n=1 Tax=Hetaerina americana TaxID=62018 RepID=UPI003A7F43E8
MSGEESEMRRRSGGGISAGGAVQLAKPLHLQQLERSLDVGPFLSFVEGVFDNPISEDDEESDSEEDADLDGSSDQGMQQDGMWNGISTTKEERRVDRSRLFNFANVRRNRKWLRNVLISSSDSSEGDEDDDDGVITEQDLQEMLKMHLLRKKYAARFHTNPENRQYQYYGAGLLSTFDRFPEHQRSITGGRKKAKKDRRLEKKLKRMKKEKGGGRGEEEEEDEEEEGEVGRGGGGRIKGGRRKSQANKKNPEVMAHRRRKIWILMAKKEVGKVQRARANNHKETLMSCRKAAQHCMRYWRQKAMQSQKNTKETIWRSKRLTREMQAYWKRFDRVERETRRRMEREAEEQRKMDLEIMEVKRQQRKLNFLITQTELYAHFMSRKLGGEGSSSTAQERHNRILSQLDEPGPKSQRLALIDHYDSEVVKAKVKKNVREALQAEQARARNFDPQISPKAAPGAGSPTSPTSSPTKGTLTGMAGPNSSQGSSVSSSGLNLTDTPAGDGRPQPKIFRGVLKHYQLKGMNWLANLYDQGINGILADEMGLGKTVQSIAFLCHIAEKYSIWGPFLVISPASTLHNWQQEVARFVPDFKVVPYWGNPQERKILRQCWSSPNLHTTSSPFHVVITSYQIVIADIKYFHRVKWQYMVLDEAQAIKSSSSMRWKVLLSFNCRNRLLLSGTPIQNSMAELWALLHFIMPTLFDSHAEFSEWFSRDIENHAENKTGIDEKHLSRLHLILKPFMLRRIKKDVENELSDKIEIMVYCPLTTRQKLLYLALKKKIRIEDLLYSSGGGSSGSLTSQSVTSSLMNLVMQFRKVCNHPELFERREAKSSMIIRPSDFLMPRIVWELAYDGFKLSSQKRLFAEKFCVYTPDKIHFSLFHSDSNADASKSGFSFSRFVDASPEELWLLALGGVFHRWKHARQLEKLSHVRHHRWVWQESRDSASLGPSGLIVNFDKWHTPANCGNDPGSIWHNLLFTSSMGTIYTHVDHKLVSMPETLEHRMMRSWKKSLSAEALLTPGGESSPKKKVEEVKVKEEMEVDSEEEDDGEEGEEDEDDEAAAERRRKKKKRRRSGKHPLSPTTPAVKSPGTKLAGQKSPPGSPLKHRPVAGVRPPSESRSPMHHTQSPSHASPRSPPPSTGDDDRSGGGIRRGRGRGRSSNAGGSGLRNWGTEKYTLLPEFRHVPHPDRTLPLLPTEIPAFLLNVFIPKVKITQPDIYVSHRRAAWAVASRQRLSLAACPSSVPPNPIPLYGYMGGPGGVGSTGRRHAFSELEEIEFEEMRYILWGIPPRLSMDDEKQQRFLGDHGSVWNTHPKHGWSGIIVPDKETLVSDAGKLSVLDSLLTRLKEQGHRVLIYSQMTRMIDLLEEYMWHRKHTYIRLDGSSKISDRRDMVADFQAREDIFVFLLSTRAGGLGINLTAADTVIFYDSDWNPTVDQQAMDRAHRLGQTKQVTVYRLICKGSIEERILQRAREKSEIQRMVISGGNFRPDTLKPKEVVSLLLDDEEIEQKYRQKQAEKRQLEESRADFYRERDRERKLKKISDAKRPRLEDGAAGDGDSVLSVGGSGPPSPSQSDVSYGSAAPGGGGPMEETSNDGPLVVDVETTPSMSPAHHLPPHLQFDYDGELVLKPRRGGKRGRPRGGGGGPGSRGGRGSRSTIRGRGRGGSESLLMGEAPLSPSGSSGGSPGSPRIPKTHSHRPRGGKTTPGTTKAAAISMGSHGNGSSPPAVMSPSSGMSGGIPVKRGPGRPRLHPVGPGHTGSRGSRPGRRRGPGHHRPLPVPLGASPATPPHPDPHRPFGFYTQNPTAE